MPKQDSFILPVSKQKAIIYGVKHKVSVRAIAGALDISMTTARKYINEAGLKTPTIDESMANRKLDKHNGFKELRRFKRFVKETLKIEHDVKIKAVSYCLNCGYMDTVEDTGNRCPKCRLYRLIAYNIITRYVADWSIH